MNLRYYLAVIGAFTIWGFFSLPLRALQSFPAFDILIFRVLITLAIMGLILFLFRRKAVKESWKEYTSMTPKEQKHLLGIHFFSGLLLAANWFLFIYVMNNVSVNATALAYLICPIMTVVLAYISLREPLTKLQWVAVFICLVSCLLMSIGHFMELLYSSIVALTYAYYPILQRKNQRLDRFVVLTLQVFVAVILLLPFYPLYVSPLPKTFYFFEIVILIAVVFTIVPLYLTIYSLRGLNSSAVGIFIYLNPIFSFLLAIFYFKENLSVLQSFSYGLILIGVILFNIPLLPRKFIKRPPKAVV